MNHEMRLDVKPFDMIKSGIKNIEYRLNDEKRQQIKIGDTITFYERPLEKRQIKVLVTNLEYYKDLLSMYTVTFNEYLKDMYSTPQDVVDATSYYTNEEVQKYGCVTIYFKIID